MRTWVMAKYVGQDKLGDILYRRRRELGLNIKGLSQETRVLPKYLEALEENNYSIFSSTAHAKGFLKIYALALGLDSEKILAVYRRDIVVEGSRTTQSTEVETEDIQPLKHTLKSRLVLHRKQLILAAGLFTVVLVLTSIFAGLNSVFQPPVLSISDPIRLDGPFNGSIDVNSRSIRFRGNASPQTVVRLNGTPLNMQTDNTFMTEELPLAQETTLFTLIATNQFGRTTEIMLSVTRTTEENLEQEAL